MIEDEELRNLFKVESEEHLQKMDAGLLKLEERPGDEDIMGGVYREVHSIKGSARIVGVVSVEEIAHWIEDLLGKARDGQIHLSSKVFNFIYCGLDVIRILVDEAVTGTPVSIDYQNALKELRIEVEKEQQPKLIDKEPTNKEALVLPLQGNKLPNQKANTSGKLPETNKKNEEKRDPQPIFKEDLNSDSNLSDTSLLSETVKGRTGSESSEQYHIDTVRVDTKLLDNLITQVGELTVTKTRVSRQLLVVENIISLLEEWEKKSYRTRLSIHDSEQIEKSSGNLQNGSIVKLLGDQEEHRDLLCQLNQLLEKLKRTGFEDSARLDYISQKLDEGIRKVRLIPLSTIFNIFPRTVRDLSKKLGKEINFIIEGGETTADKKIVEEIKDPLMHIIRNSIDHGIEHPEERERLGKSRSGTILLSAYQTSTSIMIEVKDDGRGINIDSVKCAALKNKICDENELAKMNEEQIHGLIFKAGFSTSTFVTDISGRGVGLDVVNTNVEILKGKIELKSTMGAGCKFRLSLPFTLATVRALIAVVNEVKYAIPMEYIEASVLIKKPDIYPMEGKGAISYNDNPVSVVRLVDLLELKANLENEPEEMPCVIISVDGKKIGLMVDSLVDEQEIVLKPQCFILKRVRNVSGSAVLGTGEVCKLLNPLDLIKSLKKNTAFAVAETSEENIPKKKVLLLAEDSITTRTQEKRILEMGGYEVVTAVDGLDAYHKLDIYSFDGVISDVEMPNMDGLTLTKEIRKKDKYKDLPVILVTSLASEKDKACGMEVGANAYIAKPSFDQSILLDTLKKLI